MNTVKTLIKFFSELTYKVTFSSVEDLGEGRYQIETCESFWLNEYYHIGDSYVVDQTSPLILRSLDGSVPVVGQELTLPNPMFVHGTAKRVSNELIIRKEADDALIQDPIIYLVEPFSEKKAENNIVPWDTVANLRIFIVKEYNPEAHLIEDQYNEVIDNMEVLADYVREQIELKGDLFEDIEGYELIRHIDFGFFRDLEGYVSKIFQGNLCGVEMRFSLPIKKPCIDCH